MIQDQRDILEDIMQYGIDSGKIMTTILTIIQIHNFVFNYNYHPELIYM